jgi:hypothetical protein
MIFARGKGYTVGACAKKKNDKINESVGLNQMRYKKVNKKAKRQDAADNAIS